MTTVGVLALQGDFREHKAIVESLGVNAITVRRLSELESVDALVLPGGESTTIDKLLRVFDLYEPLKQRLTDGLPVLGSCAGMILLAQSIRGGIEGQQTLAQIPITVQRNAFGRQVDSAEITLTWKPDGSPIEATFIRAPWVVSVDDPAVEVLVDYEDAEGIHPVAVRYGNAIATAFHPEISGETRLHQLLVDAISS